jgi:hypothetical protein
LFDAVAEPPRVPTPAVADGQPVARAVAARDELEDVPQERAGARDLDDVVARGGELAHVNDLGVEPAAALDADEVAAAAVTVVQGEEVAEGRAGAGDEELVATRAVEVAKVGAVGRDGAAHDDAPAVGDDDLVAAALQADFEVVLVDPERAGAVHHDHVVGGPDGVAAQRTGAVGHRAAVLDEERVVRAGETDEEVGDVAPIRAEAVDEHAVEVAAGVAAEVGDAGVPQIAAVGEDEQREVRTGADVHRAGDVGGEAVEDGGAAIGDKLGTRGRRGQQQGGAEDGAGNAWASHGSRVWFF